MEGETELSDQKLTTTIWMMNELGKDFITNNLGNMLDVDKPQITK